VLPPLSAFSQILFDPTVHKTETADLSWPLKGVWGGATKNILGTPLVASHFLQD